jgi:integrase/recombinase XerD
MMKRSSKGLRLSKAVDGFLKYKTVEGLSDTTLVTYEDHLAKLQLHLGDVRFSEISSTDLQGYLVYLKKDYVPERISGNKKPLSPKTIYNVWVTLKSLFTWAEVNGFIEINSMDLVPRPRFKERPVEALDRESVQRMIKACKYSRRAKTSGRASYRMVRPTFRRDRAILLFLLDSGVRASELIALRVCDVDTKSGEVTIRHGKAGGAKGGKGRTTFVGKSCRRALWRYLVEREDSSGDDAPLFALRNGNPLTRDGLRLLIKRLGNKAGIDRCYPHLFRHTFAISYLRSGGDVLTLQALLGHSSLEMVKRYARVAKIDLQRVHAKSSPADRWGI